ncbi:MAG: hypothetical protein WAO52_11670 [Prolixibacteraceae bacterium]
MFEADGFPLEFPAMSIGAGSAVISHANDSFFWVVTQMSSMNIKRISDKFPWDTSAWFLIHDLSDNN